MNKNYNNDEDAQVGIGTMIVFIATILVAAVAAGVLIDTSQKLQDKSTRTGSDAVSNVGTAFTVLNVWGDDSADSDEDFDEIYIDLQLSAGADPVDLNNVVITYNDGGALVVYEALAAGLEDSESTDDKFWLASTVRDGDDSVDGDVVNKDDIVRIGLGRSAEAVVGFGLEDLGADFDVTLTISTPNGSPISVGFSTPSHIDPDAYVRLF